MDRTLDRLDLGILKTLLVNNGVPPPGNPVLKKSFRSMARELGVDQATIRKRIKKFQERRILKGWYLGMNPGLTGQDVFYCWFALENESEKEGVTERLLSLPDLERVCNYLGPTIKMVLICDKGVDIDGVRNQLSRLAGSRAIMRSHSFLEVPPLNLGETDLRIIGSLRSDPWRPYRIVAKELGLSPRTVKRRVERLSEEGRIYMLPVIDLKALQGAIPVDLIVEYASGESRASVNELITVHVKEELMFSGNFGPVGYFSLMVPNVARVEQIVGWVRRQAGVRHAQADVLQDVILNKSHFQKRHLKETYSSNPLEAGLSRSADQNLAPSARAWVDRTSRQRRPSWKSPA